MTSRAQRPEATPSVVPVINPRRVTFLYISTNTHYWGEVDDRVEYEVKEPTGTLTMATGEAIRTMNGYWICLDVEVTRKQYVKLDVAPSDVLNQSRPKTVAQGGN
jgi:hypothetical protein